MQKIRSRRPTRTLRKGEIMDKDKKNWMMVAWTAIEAKLNMHLIGPNLPAPGNEALNQAVIDPIV